MQNSTIMTLPIKPQSNVKTGLLLTPLLLETIAKITGSNAILMLNLLHSYKDYRIHNKNFINTLEENNISNFQVRSDVEFLERYKALIQKLYDKGFIKIKKKNICQCNCGKIELLKDALDNMNNPKMIQYNNNIPYCEDCHSHIHEIEKDCLIFECRNLLDVKIKVFPNYLEGSYKGAHKNLNVCDLLISKQRNTNVSVQLDGKPFNIDIDFLLYLTPQLVDTTDVCMVFCNRHGIHTLLTNYINSVLGNKNLRFILHPYILNHSHDEVYENLVNDPRKSVMKSSLLNAISWNNIDSHWDPSKYKFLLKNGMYLELINNKQNITTDLDELLRCNNNPLIDYCAQINSIQKFKKNQRGIGDEKTFDM